MTVAEAVAAAEAVAQTIDEAPPLRVLRRDIRAMLADLEAGQARSIVDYYYMSQRRRIIAGQQERALDAQGEPHALMSWLTTMDQYSENVIRLAMDDWSMRSPIGRWSRSHVGVGPVLAAGLLAYCLPLRRRTASALWRHAGLDPTVVWNRNEKRPWNAKLKVLCYRLGESFVKKCNIEGAYYGAEYVRRKAIYTERNQSGAYAEYAKARLSRYSKSTEAYKALAAGRLPQAQVHARARRATVKLFLSHWWEVAYIVEHGSVPTPSWIAAHDPKHHHYPPPNWPLP